MTPEQKEALLNDIDILKADVNRYLEKSLPWYESGTPTVCLDIIRLFSKEFNDEPLVTLARLGLSCVGIVSKEILIKNEESHEISKKD